MISTNKSINKPSEELCNFIVDKLSLHPGHVLNGKDIPEAIFYDTSSLNFLCRANIAFLPSAFIIFKASFCA